MRKKLTLTIAVLIMGASFGHFAHPEYASAQDFNFKIDDDDDLESEAPQKEPIEKSQAHPTKDIKTPTLKILDPIEPVSPESLSSEDQDTLAALYIYSNLIQEEAIVQNIDQSFDAMVSGLQYADEVAPDHWSRFFYGSNPYFGAIRSPNPVIGFYNMLFDAWVVVVMKYDNDGQLQIHDTFVKTGREMRGENLDGTKLKPDWVEYYETAETQPFIGIWNNILNAEPSMSKHWPLLSSAPYSGAAENKDQTARFVMERISFFVLNLVHAFENTLVENTIIMFEDAVDGDESVMKNIVGPDNKPYKKEEYAEMFPWVPVIFLGNAEKSGVTLITMPHIPNQMGLLVTEKGKPPLLAFTAFGEEVEAQQ